LFSSSFSSLPPFSSPICFFPPFANNFSVNQCIVCYIAPLVSSRCFTEVKIIPPLLVAASMKNLETPLTNPDHGKLCLINIVMMG
jgi:hypothetical protein